MPEINHAPIVEEDAFDASSLNSRFLEVQNGLNSLPGSSVKEKGLTVDQLPSAVDSAFVTTLQVWAEEPLSLVVPGEDATAWGPLVVQGTQALISFAVPYTLSDSPGVGEVGGLLVSLDLLIFKISYSSTRDLFVGTRLQWQNAAAFWFDVEGSERFSSSMADADPAHNGTLQVQHTTRHFISASDAPSAVHAIRIQRILKDPNVLGATSYAPQSHRFSYVPLKGRVL